MKKAKGENGEPHGTANGTTNGTNGHSETMETEEKVIWVKENEIKGYLKNPYLANRGFVKQTNKKHWIDLERSS